MADSLVNELVGDRRVISDSVDDEYIARMYNALMKKEHQGFIDRDDYDPWIRTKVRGSGSSAFGPVQLTAGKGSMMHNVGTGYTNIGATKDEMDWINNVFLPQGQKFLKWGGADMPESKMDEFGNYVGHYDYGGIGSFSKEDKEMYENISKKLIMHELNRLGGDEDKFIKTWRGADDKDYSKDVKDYLLGKH